MTDATDRLITEIPAWAGPIRNLKSKDADFARLCDSYDVLHRHLQETESRADPVSDAQSAQFRRSRTRLKEQILIALAHAERPR